MLHRFLNQLLYPELDKVGLIVGGEALRCREKKLHKHWQSHYQQTINLTNSWAESLPNHTREQLVVLGAGEARDFSNTTSKRFLRTLLVDGDPGAKRSLQTFLKSSPGTGFIITNLSTMLSELAEQLKRRIAGWSWQASLAEIRHLPEEYPINPLSLPVGTGSAILSLNILSQLCVSWQYIIEGELTKNFGSTFVKSHEDEWVSAYILGGKRLIEEHAALITKHSPRAVLIISDEEIVHYYTEHSDCEPKFNNTELIIPGEIERIERISALCGYSLLNNEDRKRLFPEFSSKLLDTWSWRISPLGSEADLAEHRNFGTLHRIVAIALTPK